MGTFMTDIQAKALVLHYGFRLTEAAATAFDDGYLAKRRVYSNYDDGTFFDVKVPPEIIFPDTGVIATAILKKDSPLLVDYRDGGFCLIYDGQAKPVDFLKTPPFYGKHLKNGDAVESHITKLFGHSIGIFARTSCHFARKGQVCKFCSISSNRGRPADMCRQVEIETILEAVEIAVTLDDTIDDVFISGGVSTGDFDENFLFYSKLAIAVKQLLLSMGKSIEVTLNTYPPSDLTLVDRLGGTGIAVMVSIETVTDERRAFICPGKSELFHAHGVDNLLRKFVDTVGYGRVLVFLIHGMEDEHTLLNGVRHLAQMGVCPVVHILHVDPGTWVYEQNMTPPSPDRIVEVAKITSTIYHEYKLDSSVLYGGRSSLDAEASRGID